MKIRNLCRNVTGASAAEYAMILAIVGSALAGAALFLGNSIANSMTNAGTCLSEIRCPGGQDSGNNGNVSNPGNDNSGNGNNGNGNGNNGNGNNGNGNNGNGNNGNGNNGNGNNPGNGDGEPTPPPGKGKR